MSYPPNPNDATTRPTYLRNITQALFLDQNNNVAIRTGITGDVIINGPVTIPGTVTVNSSPSDPVHTHVSEVGTSGVLNVPYMPVGGTVTANQGTSPWVVSGNLTTTPSGTQTVTLGQAASDAFGRLRVSNPQTLFDTQARYYNHDQYASSVTGTGSYVYDSNSSTFALNVGSSNGDAVAIETYKVFPYQPGKSLLIYKTFCMNALKTNLRQRAGYFSSANGVYFEVNETTLYLVIRSSSSGVVTEERVAQSNWNGDRLDGTGQSGIILNPALDQILFTDIEWLGVGSVRAGFVINGTSIIAHTFHHANVSGNITTYMTTACLPLRMEITNIGATSGPSTLRQICSSVISEGGYQLSGTPRSIGHNIDAPVRLPNDQTFKPLIAMRLNSANQDSIVLPTFFTIAPVAQSTFKYRIYSRAITTGGAWANMSTGSVQYNLAPTAISSGEIVSEGFIISSNQTAAAPSQSAFGFEVQLQRQPFTGVMYEYVLAAATTGTNQDVYASIEWQEVN